VRRTLLLLVTAALLSGCGSSGDDTATFEEDGFDISFEYPAEMKEASNVPVASGAGGAAKATAGIGYDKRDVIIVQRYDLNRVVDEDNLGSVKSELDRLVAQISPGAGAGDAGTTSGFPSIDYRGLAVRSIEDAESRLVALFDGDVQYLVNCQSTPGRRADVEKACEQVLRTVERR
jgi:hypothetical protein